jgi:hypothetical protein
VGRHAHHSERLDCSATREPIAPHGISNEIIKPDEQPEQFMRNLWLMYRSPYFRAVKAAA